MAGPVNRNQNTMSAEAGTKIFLVRLKMTQRNKVAPNKASRLHSITLFKSEFNIKFPEPYFLESIL